MGRVFLSLLLLSCLVSTCTATMICQHTINNITYDLSPLSGHDYYVSPSDGDYNYYINVCGAVQASSCSASGSAFVCQVRKEPLNKFESVIAYDDDAHLSPTWTQSKSIAGGVTLTFENGPACNLWAFRQGIIDFQCDTTGSGAMTVVESPQCTFTVVFPTPHVCVGPTPVPSSSSSSSSTGLVSSTASSSTGLVSSTGSSPTSSPSSASSTSDEWPHLVLAFFVGIAVSVLLMACGVAFWYMRSRATTDQHAINTGHYAQMPEQHA